MDKNKKNNRVSKNVSTNALSLSLRNLADEVANDELMSSPSQDDGFSENVQKGNDKPESNKQRNNADGIFDKVLFDKLEKIKEDKKNSLFTNIRIRKEFRNYLNQICFLEQFQDYTMGDVMEAVFNTYMESHLEALKKQSLLRKSI